MNTSHLRQGALGLAVAAALAVSSVAVEGQSSVRVGADLGWGDDFGLAVGGRLTADIDAFENDDSMLKSLRGIGQFLYSLEPFEGCDRCDLWEINLNGALPFRLSNSAADFYAGGGLNIARFDFPDGFANRGFDDTDLGLNVIGGLNFDLGTLSSFAEVKVGLGGSDQVFIGGGVMFGN